MLEVLNLTVALPSALFVAAYGDKILSKTGLIPYAIVSMLGLLVSTWMLHRVHSYAKKVSVNNYVDLMKTLYDSPYESPRVGMICILFMLPMIQLILHLALNQVELERWPMFGVKAAVALVLIASTAIPYAIKVVPFMAIIGWICLLAAGAISWAPNPELTMLPLEWTTKVVYYLIVQFSNVAFCGSLINIVGYETNEIYVVFVNLLVQLVALAYPVLFAATKFKAVSLYLAIPIILASLFLLAHHLYQRDVDAKTRPSASLRYGLPLGVLIFCSVILAMPFMKFSQLLSPSMIELDLFLLGAFTTLPLVQMILLKHGETIKQYLVTGTFVILCLAKVVLYLFY